MNKTTTISPLVIIEDYVFDKVKDRSFKVWHYVVALAFLTVIPTVIVSFVGSDLAHVFIAVVVAMAWLASRVIGRSLSRNSAIDSVLIYRYFAAVPWLITVVASGITLLAVRMDGLTSLITGALFWAGIVVSLMHVLGIIVHLYKRKRMVRNIKKEDLFQ